MRKLAFCIWENKGADHRASDQRLCFRYMDSTIPLLPISEIPSLYHSSVADWLYSPVLSNLVGTFEDRFSVD